MRYFEDFPVGTTMRFGAYEVTAEEITEYANQYDPSVLVPGCPGGEGGKAVASGWHVCAMMMHMLCEGFVLKSAGLGAPGIDKLKWLSPVCAGHVLGMETEVMKARRSASRPGIGLVYLRHSIRDQSGEMKLVCENWVMLATREGSAA